MSSRRPSTQSSIYSARLSGSPASTPSSTAGRKHRKQKKEKKKSKHEELSPEDQAKRDKRLLKKEELSREHDKILAEIENHDKNSVNLALKNVYVLGHVSRFEKKLEKQIRTREREIERMCGFHYTNFVEAINELSGIEGDATKLVRKVASTNHDLQELGGKILGRHNEILRIRKQQSNINSTIGRLSSLLPALLEMKKLEAKMKLGKYYSALKIIQLIRHEHLENCRQFHFSKIMISKFANYKSEISKTSEKEFKNYLESVQSNSTAVGCQILKRYTDGPAVHVSNTRKRQIENEMPEADQRQGSSNPFGSEDEETKSEFSVATTTFGNHHFDEDVSIQELIDFKPLYKCLHIHRLLGGNKSFITQYRLEREEQAALLFRIPKKRKKSNINFAQLFADFLTQILGFFAVEDFVHHSTRTSLGTSHVTSPSENDNLDTLVNRTWLERQLLTAVSKVVILIRTENSDECRQLIEIKKLILAFSKSLESYGFFDGVEDVEAVLPDIMKQYNQGLLSQYGHIFTTSISDDNLLPITVSNQDEEETFSSFSFAQIILKSQSKFPKTLPFSKSVLVIHQLLQKYIASAYDFCSDFLLTSPSEITVELSRSVESLLQRNLRTIMEQSINRENAKDLTLNQILQFVTNLSYMEKSVRDVETNIRSHSTDKFSEASRRAPRRMREIGKQLFEDIRRQAESIINPKINDELDLKLKYKFDWQMNECLGTSSPYLKEAYKFLEKVFDNLRTIHMRDELINDVYFGAYQHIGFSFMEKIIDERIISVNMGALHQISLDVLFAMNMLEYAGPNLTEDQRENLEMVYSEVYQLTQLFIEWDWEKYFQEIGSEDAKYSLVNPGIALKIIEKLRQDKKNRNILASLNINKRKKEKVQDTIIKQLRELIKDWSLLTVPHRSLSADQQNFFRDP